jgi:hypothetical protein
VLRVAYPSAGPEKNLETDPVAEKLLYTMI